MRETDPLIERLNLADEAAFVAELGPLYEHSPSIAAAAFQGRPFADRDGLHGVMQRIVRDAPHDRQLALIRAHPDLAGRLARAGTLASRSASEQNTLGVDRLSDADHAHFDRLNGAYRQRFGMPFIIAVRAQTLASVIAAFETRLGHELEDEIDVALGEIGRIARFRLDDLP